MSTVTTPLDQAIEDAQRDLAATRERIAHVMDLVGKGQDVPPGTLSDLREIAEGHEYKLLRAKERAAAVPAAREARAAAEKAAEPMLAGLRKDLPASRERAAAAIAVAEAAMLAMIDAVREHGADIESARAALAKAGLTSTDPTLGEHDTGAHSAVGLRIDGAEWVPPSVPASFVASVAAVAAVTMPRTHPFRAAGFKDGGGLSTAATRAVRATVPTLHRATPERSGGWPRVLVGGAEVLGAPTDPLDVKRAADRKRRG